MGFLDAVGLGRLKEGLARTREGLVGRIARLAATRSTLDDDVVDQLEEILIAGDVGVSTTSSIVEGVRRRVKEERYAGSDDLIRIVKEEVVTTLPARGGAERLAPFATGETRPYVIMVVGINGVGKTTTIGKLAHKYVREGLTVVIAAADTFRAAANEQLAIWAERAGAAIVSQRQGSDPGAVVFDTIQAAVARKTDVVIVDTAGRLHTRVNLMEELRKIRRVIDKALPGAPHEVLLVLDASTGQNGIHQARQFDSSVGVTGLVITKLDGTAKGGVVLAVTRELSVPVRFIGVGERIDDLQPFEPASFVDALFGGETLGTS